MPCSWSSRLLSLPRVLKEWEKVETSGRLAGLPPNSPENSNKAKIHSVDFFKVYQVST
jgi:hypothetical protein